MNGDGELDLEELLERYGNQAEYLLREFDLDGSTLVSLRPARRGYKAPLAFPIVNRL
jgi:hypothetical protein